MHTKNKQSLLAAANKSGAGCTTTQPLSIINHRRLTMKKLINSFKAIDENGKQYRIDCYQTFHTSRTLSGTAETLAGLKEYRCGHDAVSCIDANTFEILRSETMVKKVA